MLQIAHSDDKTRDTGWQMTKVLETQAFWRQPCERCCRTYLHYQYLICQLEASFSFLPAPRGMWIAECALLMIVLAETHCLHPGTRY